MRRWIERVLRAEEHGFEPRQPAWTPGGPHWTLPFAAIVRTLRWRLLRQRSEGAACFIRAQVCANRHRPQYRQTDSGSSLYGAFTGRARAVLIVFVDSRGRTGAAKKQWQHRDRIF